MTATNDIQIYSERDNKFIPVESKPHAEIVVHELYNFGDEISGRAYIEDFSEKEFDEFAFTILPTRFSFYFLGEAWEGDAGMHGKLSGIHSLENVTDEEAELIIYSAFRI